MIEEHKPRILIVDDTIEFIDIIVKTLEPKYHIFATTSPIKGIEIAKKNDIDMILLDFKMPEMDGITVCKKLKNIPETAKIPVIFLTSQNDTEYEAMGLEAGAVDYIHKPFNAAVLMARVNTHLSLHELQQSLEEKVAEAAGEIIKLNKEIVFRMASIAEYKSKETGYHIRRVAEYSALLGELVGLSMDDVEKLRLASTMHDMGKVGIPDAILHKPGKLEMDEWEVMQQHSKIGYDMLINSEFELLRFAALIAYEHHEKWDGSGYPSGIRSEETHIFSRITAISDVLDALLDKRSYKAAWPPENVKSFFAENAGSHFDPNLTEIFLENFDKFLEIWVKFQDDEKEKKK